MTLNEYFGQWLRMFDKNELSILLTKLKEIPSSTICPEKKNIFKAFELCDYNKCRVICIGQDPYPQKGVANGIAFGNKADTKEENLSPSLKVLKESVINFEIPHNCINFDNTLESWAKQGILMLNSALTCEMNKVNSHAMLWRPFISKFIYNMSRANTGIVYVLFGSRAKTLKPYIGKHNFIIETEHPAYCARNNTLLPYSLFSDINKMLKEWYNEEIIWFNELNN